MLRRPETCFGRGGLRFGVRKIDLERDLSVPRYKVMTFDRSTTVLLTECLRPSKEETEVCRNLFNTDRVKIPKGESPIPLSADYRVIRGDLIHGRSWT
jgi:hypothetical protein